MNEKTQDSFWRRCVGSSPNDTRNQLRLAGGTLGWAVVLVACSFTLKQELIGEGIGRWLVAAIPTIAGVGLIALFVHYLSGIDEFQRTVQLQILGVAFGGTFLVASGYSVFERVGAPALGANDVAAIMPVLYAVGGMFAAWRHR